MEEKSVQRSWLDFVDEVQDYIFPIYLQHERTFDNWCVHGRIHISRALMFAEVMGRMYLQKEQKLDLYSIRVAVAFHDAGRKSNGPDRWESDSADQCYRYLLENCGEETASTTSGFILKGPGNHSLPARIVHDADVLEIMRPSCGHGGIGGFRANALGFLGERDPLVGLFPDAAEIRSQMISEAWQWILQTEDMKLNLAYTQDYLNQLLILLTGSVNNYPLLSQLVTD